MKEFTSILSFHSPHTSRNLESRNKIRNFSNKQKESQVHARDNTLTTPVRTVIAGFTLIELLVVVLIIGILAAVSLPKYELAVKKTRMNNYLLVFRKVKESMAMYLLASGGQFPDTLNDLDIEMPACTVRVVGASSYYDCKGFSLRYWGPSQLHLNIEGPNLHSQAFYTHSAEPTQKILCRASADIDKKICQSLGGKLVYESSSEFRYEMP